MRSDVKVVESDAWKDPRQRACAEADIAAARQREGKDATKAAATQPAAVEQEHPASAEQGDLATAPPDEFATAQPEASAKEQPDEFATAPPEETEVAVDEAYAACVKVCPGLLEQANTCFDRPPCEVKPECKEKTGPILLCIEDTPECSPFKKFAESDSWKDPRQRACVDADIAAERQRRDAANAVASVSEGEEEVEVGTQTPADSQEAAADQAAALRVVADDAEAFAATAEKAGQAAQLAANAAISAHESAATSEGHPGELAKSAEQSALSAATAAASDALEAAQAAVDAASQGTDDLTEAQGKLDAAKAIVERGGAPAEEIAAAAVAPVQAANATRVAVAAAAEAAKMPTPEPQGFFSKLFGSTEPTVPPSSLPSSPVNVAASEAVPSTPPAADVGSPDIAASDTVPSTPPVASDAGSADAEASEAVPSTAPAADVGSADAAASEAVPSTPPAKDAGSADVASDAKPSTPPAASTSDAGPADAKASEAKPSTPPAASTADGGSPHDAASEEVQLPSRVYGWDHSARPNRGEIQEAYSTCGAACSGLFEHSEDCFNVLPCDVSADCKDVAGRTLLCMSEEDGCKRLVKILSDGAWSIPEQRACVDADISATRALEGGNVASNTGDEEANDDVGDVEQIFDSLDHIVEEVKLGHTDNAAHELEPLVSMAKQEGDDDVAALFV